MPTSPLLPNVQYPECDLRLEAYLPLDGRGSFIAPPLETPFEYAMVIYSAFETPLDAGLLAGGSSRLDTSDPAQSFGLGTVLGDDASVAAAGDTADGVDRNVFW